MNHVIVQKLDNSQAILDEIGATLFSLPGELRKVAAFILENPNEIAVVSARGLARAAGVKPNSVVRFARHLGFSGHDDMRAVFQQEVRQGASAFQDRARGLQTRSEEGALGDLFADMAQNAITNIESSFAATNADAMQAAAKAICAARTVYVLGVGINHTIGRNFSYLVDMAVGNVVAIPRDGNLAIDDIARAGPGDVLIAMTFKPYRVEVVDSVKLARSRGVIIIGVSDSPAAPLIVGSDHGFVVQTDTPQFFTSTFSALALMETLVAFVVAEAGDDVIVNIQQFHDRRHELGFYIDEPIDRPAAPNSKEG